MAEYAAKRDPNRCPTHPGALLREVMPATAKTKTEIAALLGISRQHLYDILAERKPVSPAVAVPVSASCSATGPASGCACRAPTTPGAPNATWPPKSRKYRRSARPRREAAGPGKTHFHLAPVGRGRSERQRGPGEGGREPAE